MELSHCNHSDPAYVPWSCRVGTNREAVLVMLPLNDSMHNAPSASEQDLRPRARTLSWMASLSVAAGEIRAAEGYLLELLAWCAFADREGAEATPDEDEL